MAEPHADTVGHRRRVCQPPEPNDQSYLLRSGEGFQTKNNSCSNLVETTPKFRERCLHTGQLQGLEGVPSQASSSLAKGRASPRTTTKQAWSSFAMLFNHFVT